MLPTQQVYFSPVKQIKLGKPKGMFLGPTHGSSWEQRSGAPWRDEGHMWGTGEDHCILCLVIRLQDFKLPSGWVPTIFSNSLLGICFTLGPKLSCDVHLGSQWKLYCKGHENSSPLNCVSGGGSPPFRFDASQCPHSWVSRALQESSNWPPCLHSHSFSIHFFKTLK